MSKLVTIYGGSGFVGRYIVRRMAKAGWRVRVAVRNPNEAMFVRPYGVVGQVEPILCNVRDDASVKAAMQGADAVVNLVGAFSGNLRRLMGEAPGWMAEAAARAGAQAFVHVSAIAAEPEDETEIEYAAAKKLGEERVLAAFPKATILRPSILFGEDDNFINMFAGLISTLPVLPVFGPDAKLQLVYVDDVAEAAVRALEDPGKHGGKIYELGGPEELSMMEINEAIAAAQKRKRTFLPMPDGLSATFAALPGTPMGSDQWKLLKQGNVASGAFPGFDRLGIEPKPLDLFLDRWMVRYRKHGRFHAESAV